MLFEIVLLVLLIQLSSRSALSFFPGVRRLLSGGFRYPLDAMVVCQPSNYKVKLCVSQSNPIPMEVVVSFLFLSIVNASPFISRGAPFAAVVVSFDVR